MNRVLPLGELLRDPARMVQRLLLAEVLAKRGQGPLALRDSVKAQMHAARTSATREREPSRKE